MRVPRRRACGARDPWTGALKPLPVLEHTASTTRLRLPLGEKEMQLIVFSPGKPVMADQAPIESTKSRIALSGDWEFQLKPNLDNRWGDYHWPATPTLIGAEARFFRYAEETPGATGWEKPALDDKSWRSQTYSFGQQFWKLGPMPVETDTKALEQALASSDCVDPATLLRVGNREYRWMPYDFSWRYGVEGDPGYQGYHGLKERLYDEYIRLGRLVDKHTAYQREAEPAWQPLLPLDQRARSFCGHVQAFARRCGTGCRVVERFASFFQDPGGGITGGHQPTCSCVMTSPARATSPSSRPNPARRTPRRQTRIRRKV